MSKYTTELRYICENAAGLSESVGYNDVSQVINAAIPNIFNFDFPIFDPDYKIPLCKKILMHFYTREIGSETVGLWRLRLETKLNEIMPYYNQLYKSAVLEFNPFYDVDLWTTHTGSGTHRQQENDSRGELYSETIDRDETTGETYGDIAHTSTSSNTGTMTHTSGNNNSTNWDLFSDTPQGRLSDVEEQAYLTSARKNTNGVISVEDGTANGTTSGTNDFTDNSTKSGSHDTDETRSGNRNETGNKTNNIDTTDDYTNHVAGKNGGASYSKMLVDFRNTFLNIDMLVINDLEPLFMGLW